MINLKLSRRSTKKQKKALSVFFSSVLAVNTCAMIRVETRSATTVDAKALRAEIIENAAAYLDSKENADHSFGDSGLVNDTSEALIALRIAGKTGYEDSGEWIADNISFTNTDMTARLAAATGNASDLDLLENKQNEDGGFGLYPEYASDVLDSALMLEAVNDTGYSGSSISGDKICVYLMNAANSDGGYSYTAATDSDPLLTSIVVYNVGRYLNAHNFDTSPLTSSLTYIEDNIKTSYNDSSIESTICKYLAMQAMNEDIDPIKVVNELDKAEKSDGSFAEDIHTTSLAIRLLSELDLENKLTVTSFDTKLSDTEASAGKSSTITAQTEIGYTSNYDAVLELKLRLFNGKNFVAENAREVKCLASENSISVDAGALKLSEPDGDDVYVLAELYNGTKLVKSQKININITSSEPKTSTEITDLSVELDANTLLSGEDKEVGVSYSLLYATNVNYPVQMKTIVTRDGKQVKSVVEDAVLVQEKNVLAGNPLTFEPDTSSGGTYTVTVICLDGGKEICRRSAELKVTDPPVIEEKKDESEETKFEITWFGPVLSDYYVYAGNETEINAGAEINYFSNGIFNGKVELEVKKGDETVTATTFDVELEKGVETYFEGKANYPVYKSGDQVTFTVKNVGEYVVNAKLYDQNGELLKEGSRKLRVVDKPVQDLILNSKVDEERENTVDLWWNDISNDAESYSYQLNRKTNGGKWEPRSIWNEEEHIRVLNVYPASPYLVDWMNNTISDTELPAGKGIFEIEPVHISTFNSDPDKYIYNDDGSWKCDVIFFGASDCNSGYDLNDVSLEATEKFIDSGRGVLFGHDTICGGSGYTLEHRKFNKLAEKAGLLVATPSPEVWYRTTSVSVVKIGTLTNYPWTIRGDLTVPNTHSTGQYLDDAIEWITLNATKRPHPVTGGLDNFYLSTKNNLGMIQTGDSTGQASDDERKILANTLFYLYQISQQTTAKDGSFYDIDAPDKPQLISSDNTDGKAVVNVKSVDNPTEYEYYITANPMNSTSESILSNIRKHKAFSDLSGFVVKLSPSSEPDPSLIEYDENRENILDVVPADKSGKAALTVEPEDLTVPQYIHIFAVDNANNVSEEYIMPFAENDLITGIDTDKQFYSYGDTVAINADTISAPFGRTADMSIEIYDEFDNKTAELVSVPDQVLNPSEKLESSAEWAVPQETVGRYKAVISWKNNDTVIAAAETGFKIANEQSISNLISSDKKNYSGSDPVNLASDVFNNSDAMTENDLVLNIKVYDQENKEVASFTHEIGALSPEGHSELSDAIAPGTLKDGNYTAVASVTQGTLEVSSDKAEFTVKNDVTLFIGTLDLTSSDGKGTADFIVKNNGAANAENVTVTVKVYKDDASEPVYVFTDNVSIVAGGTYKNNTAFDLPVPEIGKYSGVISVTYNGEASDLDYDGFDEEETPVETETAEVPETTVSSSETTTTFTTSADNADSPKTGDGGIPVYMWLISAASIAGLIAVRRRGGIEND